MSHSVMSPEIISNPSKLKLHSDDIFEGQSLSLVHVYNEMGCMGENLSPALSWSDAPQGTKSFAVTVFDPDAPTRYGWWHWLLYNIPNNILSIPRGVGCVDGYSLPHNATEAPNDYGKYCYGGACPPVGSNPHRYQFSVYALDTESLPVKKSATADQVYAALENHRLAKDTITSYYSR